MKTNDPRLVCRTAVLTALMLLTLSGPMYGQPAVPVPGGVIPLSVPVPGEDIPIAGFSRVRPPNPYALLVQEHARAVLQNPQIVCTSARKESSWTILDVVTTGFRSGPVETLEGAARIEQPVPAYVGSYTLRGEDGIERHAYGSVFLARLDLVTLPPRPIRWEDGVLGQHIVTVDEELPADPEAAARLMDRVLGGAGPRFFARFTTRFHPQSGEPTGYWFVGNPLGALTFGGTSRSTAALGVIAAGPRCFVVHTTGYGPFADVIENWGH